MSDNKKYYWLKLKRDFFKRHDITVIESMQNGDKYLLFYMKLLVESIDHDGSLRFSDTVPYNDTMLSAITHTDIDIVRSAVKVFEQFGMMDVMDDGTLYMKQIDSMIGDETEWAAKKREYREGQKRTLSDKRLEIRDKSIEIRDKNIDKETPAKTFKKPTRKAIVYSQDFLNFWDIYPKKESKGKAYQCFNKLIKDGVKQETIHERLKIYKERIRAMNTGYGYIRNPDTFLNNIDDYADGFVPKPQHTENLKPLTVHKRTTQIDF